MTPVPKRRWLRFSLRTLFVLVTFLACWLGYHVRWIHQRRDALASGIVGFPIDGVHAESPPWQLRILGEQMPTPVDLLLPFDAPDSEVERIKSLFPECAVRRNGEPPS